MSKKTGDKYDLIGQEFGEADEKWPSHLAHDLPACVDALFYLAQMGAALVLELIADGEIQAGLTANMARELRNTYRPDLNKQRPFDVGRWIRRLHKLMDDLEAKATPQDLALLLAELERITTGLSSKMSNHG